MSIIKDQETKLEIQRIISSAMSLMYNAGYEDGLARRKRREGGQKLTGISGPELGKEPNDA